MESKRSALWTRLAIVLVTLAALGLILRRIHFDALLNAFRNMHWGWFSAALVLYGSAFLFSAWRWHLVLRLTGTAVHATASARLTLIGHFFYNLLFGAVGGDTAKAALYARWYNWKLPVILATLPIDRLLGLMGLIVLAAIGLCFKAGSEVLHGAKFPPPATIALWSGVIIASAGLVILILKRLKPGEAWKSFRTTFFRTARLIASSPSLSLAGILSGFLVQVALNGTMALNLKAVSHGSINWAGLWWTLPAIAVASGLPVTIAGLGTREGAALALLGMYGVGSAEAVAASLLTFTVSMLWSAVGGILLWRESARQRRRLGRPETISVVIPTLNEAEALPEALRRAQAVPEVGEVIVSDGGSHDGTQQLAAQHGCRVVSGPPGRGGQLKRGAAVAKGDVLLFLHADTWLPPEAGKAVLDSLRDRFAVGGGFWKVFRETNVLLLGSRLKCAIRLYAGGRIMGDQAIFVRRETLEQVGGMPDLPLMEEFELCRRLKRAGRLVLAGATIQTSARRFTRLGILRTYARMWMVMLRYYLGASPQDLKRIYEKD